MDLSFFGCTRNSMPVVGAEDERCALGIALVGWEGATVRCHARYRVMVGVVVRGIAPIGWEGSRW